MPTVVTESTLGQGTTFIDRSSLTCSLTLDYLLRRLFFRLHQSISGTAGRPLAGRSRGTDVPVRIFSLFPVSTHLEPMPVPNVPAVQIVQVVFRKFEGTGGPLFNKNYAPLFSLFVQSLRYVQAVQNVQPRCSVQDIKKITTVQQFNSSTRTAKATPGFSSNRKKIDNSPVRRYCSGQKKGGFKFPIHNVILALCYATASG
jgi:hypothetical protein